MTISARPPRPASRSARHRRGAARVAVTVHLLAIALAALAGRPLAAQPAARAGDTAPAAAWRAVDDVLRDFAARESPPGIGVAVYDARDRLVYRRTSGDMTPARTLAVASASKLVAALVLLRLVDEGRLALDTTTAAVLGWRGDAGAITLRQLLSFTSGLRPEHRCLRDPATTLAACTTAIGASPLVAAPATRYDYGGTHLQVAARMAEVATGRPWATAARAAVFAPLGLDDASRWVTLPRRAIGTTNPLVAGGLRVSMDEYATLLAAVFHRGRHKGLRFTDTTLFDAMARAPFPRVTVGRSPMARAGLPFRYGLGAWLECDTPATGCARISSPGAFGFTPWLDREAGYYAIVAMETQELDERAGMAGARLAQRLSPLIRTALASPR